jgi:RND family efflux transporter MFP subunit
MQNKSVRAILLFALLLVSFGAGAWYNQHAAKQKVSSSERKILYYVDPMHPAYKSDKPGIAPDCGMALEPVYADAGGDPATDHMPAGTVNLNLEQQQLIGVRVGDVRTDPSMRKLRVLGRVAADEARIYRLNAAADGNIEDTSDKSTGSQVKKNERLATFFTADLLTSVGAYLNVSSRLPNRSELVTESELRKRSMTVAGNRLRTLGMSELQLRELDETQQLTDTIKILSPADGFILARSVSPGQHVEKGAEFYRIADLSQIWILADVFGEEAKYLRPGTVAMITLPNQGKTLQARVSNVLPQFDPTTRTMKLRLETENPGFVLRPGMFVDVELPVPVPAGLSIPTDALLDSGLKKRVFIDRGNGYFVPREVETGWQFGDRVQIVNGLSTDDRIVVSGTFLLDSESRLKNPLPADRGDDPNRLQTDHHLTPAMDSKKELVSARDPYCGMNVVPAKSKTEGNTTTYKGKYYYFCSTNCRDNFLKEPNRYVSAGKLATHSPGMKVGAPAHD